MTSPILQLLQAAYMAQDAIERMTDPQSIWAASSALGIYAKALMEAPPQHQAAISKIRDERDRGVPTLSELHQLFLATYVAIYIRIHNTNPAAA
ncbi:MAG TPA: hypothetical protein VN436_13645 [Holophaga sp.]|nr:hypothetical protein [Holophaga sp.]